MWDMSMNKFIIFFMLISFLATTVFWGVIVFVIPWLWTLIKPWLHSITG